MQGFETSVVRKLGRGGHDIILPFVRTDFLTFGITIIFGWRFFVVEGCPVHGRIFIAELLASTHPPTKKSLDTAKCPGAGEGYV